ncbi:farnesyl-diphosphate synthase [Acidobacteriota bacterium]|nr:farnesyl-diphosphate synthase [Acidobacteriota bacterium]
MNDYALLVAQDQSRLLPFIEKELVARFHQLPPNTPLRDLQAAIKYSLEAGGKRIRPMLCLLACEACGQAAESALPGAIAVEYVHTYSLIHDDLPAMDNDDLRRGKPSNHKVFGEGQAILAGDALLTEAFALLAETQNPMAVACLARGAGWLGMVGGQSLDLQFENQTLEPDLLPTIHQLKTGKLMRAALELGGIFAQASSREVSALGSFGETLGLAFQIKDDLLDATSNAHHLGKSTQKDQQRGKLTYVTVMGLEKAEATLGQVTQDALKHLAGLPNPQALTAWAHHLTKRAS